MANFVKTNESIVESTQESLLILPVGPAFSVRAVRRPLNINVLVQFGFFYLL